VFPPVQTPEVLLLSAEYCFKKRVARPSHVIDKAYQTIPFLEFSSGCTLYPPYRTLDVPHRCLEVVLLAAALVYAASVAAAPVAAAPEAAAPKAAPPWLLLP
jgi:hypothetical protein